MKPGIIKQQAKMWSIMRTVVYPGAFHNFYEQTPPDGWAVRNGAMLGNVSNDYAELLAHLQKQENAWKLKSETQWRALVNTSPFNGEGGAPYFVLDLEADTIRLPDTRNMIMTDAGSFIAVGASQGDAQQNITGQIDVFTYLNGGRVYAEANAALGAITSLRSSVSSTTAANGSTAINFPSGIKFDASRQIRTASEVRSKRFGGLGCVYIGGNW